MNFSFIRFSYLLKLQLAVNRKRYLLGAASIAGMLLAFMFFLSYMEGLDYQSQEFTFMIGLLLSSTIFTSTIFKQFSRTDDRTMAMMLPASAGERLAVAALLSLVLYPLVFILICVPCILLVNYIDVHWRMDFHGYYLPNREALYWFGANFFIQSFVLVTAIWFRKHVFVKSVAAVCLVAFGLTVVNNNSASMVIDRAKPPAVFGSDTLYRFASTIPYSAIQLKASKRVEGTRYEYLDGFYHVTLSEAMQMSALLLLCLIPLVCWTITWMKIREQQL